LLRVWQSKRHSQHSLAQTQKLSSITNNKILPRPTTSHSPQSFPIIGQLPHAQAVPMRLQHSRNRTAAPHTLAAVAQERAGIQTMRVNMPPLRGVCARNAWISCMYASLVGWHADAQAASMQPWDVCQRVLARVFENTQTARIRSTWRTGHCCNEPL
jgi:hypothetical protein